MKIRGASIIDRLLLEGIFMILFNTYQYPGYYSRYATMSSYRLTEKIINLLGIPSVPWRGMNAALKLCVQRGRQSLNAYIEILEILWGRISVVVVTHTSHSTWVYFRTKKFLQSFKRLEKLEQRLVRMQPAIVVVCLSPKRKLEQ
jgi:hypothetical protein